MSNIPTPNSDKPPFLAAAAGEMPAHTPVWFMRQAGRSLPEYKKLRKKGSILDSLADPELAAEITLQPIRRYGVDAAILYSDIMVPLCALDRGVQILEGRGPVIENPYESSADLKRLRPLEPDADLANTLKTIKILSAELEVPLIGFAGAPFTLASYLIEGGPSKNYAKTKRAMYADGAFFQNLMELLADIALSTLKAQIKAGVQAVQLFDSWAGVLRPRDYEKYVLPHTQKIFGGLVDSGVPLIHFGVGTGELLPLMAQSGATLLGIDWRVDMRIARQRIEAANIKAIQGNLDPAVCLADWENVEAAVLEVLAQNDPQPQPETKPDPDARIGHIFNLGHGVLPETDPDILARIVDLVHSNTQHSNNQLEQ